ncbi:MAG: APC family permease [Acidobacteria bacterium]|nr:APC family permease [Acidobacteriota bacterium]
MSNESPHLRRVLGLWDLVLYGIVLVQPIAPVPLFGIAQQLSAGHAVTTIVFAMFAMGLTAVSYGRMAAVYPSAGSAYTYVSRSLHPTLGFLTGWAMFLDYLLVPLICTIYGAITLTRLVPGVPYAVWVVLFASAITVLNLRGIKFTARASWVLMLVTTGVISAFIFLAVRYLGGSGLVSSLPFYDPGTFKLGTVLTATSVAALTYGGFDGVTTLAEEVENPRRNVMLAAVGVVLFTGLFGGLQIYLAQLVWPDYKTFGNLETAFLDVSRKVGGEWMFQSLAVVLIVASFGSALTAQAGVSRLLYSMGQARGLPAFFAHLGKRTASPVWNVTMVGVMAAAGAMVLNYERSAELINFGAFLAFMGVNGAVMRQRELGWMAGKVMPALGFLFCLSIWLNLSRPAMLMGGAWFAVGLAFHLVQRRRGESFVFEE